MTEKLLPCPWCGLSDKVVADEALGDMADGRPAIAAGCERCDVLGPWVHYEGGKIIPIPHPTELLERSITAWNTRADSAVDVIRGLQTALMNFSPLTEPDQKAYNLRARALTDAVGWLSQHAQDKPMEDKVSGECRA